MRDYTSMYDTNEITGAYLIEVNLENYLDFYHEWDSARFKKRDMHPELAEFLQECSEEIPGKEKLEISFSVEARQKNMEQERCLEESYRQYFGTAYRGQSKSILRLIRNVIISVAIAVVFLVLAELFTGRLAESIPTTVLIEGFYVGGWVFLWEAVYALAFELPEKVRAGRTDKRLLNTTLSFRYIGA